MDYLTTANSLENFLVGVFTPNDDLAKELFQASEASGEKFWRMPLEESYWESMKSGVADMVNTGGRQGGAINAALFLKQVCQFNCLYIFTHSNDRYCNVHSRTMLGNFIVVGTMILQFVDEKVKWMHIDMAGPVLNYKKHLATGFAISTLVEWILKNSSS